MNIRQPAGRAAVNEEVMGTDMTRGQRRYVLRKVDQILRDRPPEDADDKLDLVSLRWLAKHGDQKALRELREKIVR